MVLGVRLRNYAKSLVAMMDKQSQLLTLMNL